MSGSKRSAGSRIRWFGAQARIIYEPISWDDAFALIGRELNALASPDEAFFYTSGRTSNEAAFLYGLFARQFGTNNLPDCSNMCHESSGAGLTEVDRRRQGHGPHRRLRAGRRDLRHRPEPGHEPPADADRAAEGRAERLPASSASTRCKETGLMRFSNPQEPLRSACCRAPTSPACSCRCGSTATWRCSRAS